MVEIIPAVMPVSLEDLHARCALLAGVAPLIQIDLMDGAYVEGKTWPYTAGKLSADNLQLAGGLRAEIDLMVNDPQDAVARCSDAVQFVVHADGPYAQDALHALPVGKRGIALRASDTSAVLDRFAGMYDFVQVMGIEPIGVQGAPLDARALALIAAVRAAYPGLIISVDGGVNAENARALVLAGANRLVAGSAIFSREDPIAAYKKLLAAANDTIG